MTENVRPELSYTSQKILEQAKDKNISAPIHYVTFMSNAVVSSTTSLPYATTASEANEMSYLIPGIDTRAYSASDYPLYKAYNYINNVLIDNLQPDSERYCFIIDFYAEPQCNTVNGKLEPTSEILKSNGFNLQFAYSRLNENIPSYLAMATDGFCSELSITDLPDDYVDNESIKKRYNFGDFVNNTIFGNYLIVSATGWKRIDLNAPITENYRAVSMAIENNAALRDEVIAMKKYTDTDEDGLLDLEEIYYDRGDKAVIYWDSKGEAILPTFADCMQLEESLFYVESGFDRYADSMGELFYEQFAGIRILPIKSNPTSEDGDCDGVLDLNDSMPLLKNLFGVWQKSDEKYSTTVQAELLKLHFCWVLSVSDEEKINLENRAYEIRKALSSGYGPYLDTMKSITGAAADEFAWFLGGDVSKAERDYWLYEVRKVDTSVEITEENIFHATMFIAGLVSPSPDDAWRLISKKRLKKC